MSWVGTEEHIKSPRAKKDIVDVVPRGQRATTVHGKRSATKQRKVHQIILAIDIHVIQNFVCFRLQRLPWDSVCSQQMGFGSLWRDSRNALARCATFGIRRFPRIFPWKEVTHRMPSECAAVTIAFIVPFPSITFSLTRRIHGANDASLYDYQENNMERMSGLEIAPEPAHAPSYHKTLRCLGETRAL